MHFYILITFFLINLNALFTDPKIKVSTWNMRAMGLTKLKRPGLLPILARVICRSDIQALQEIRSSDGTEMINEILKAIEKEKECKGKRFSAVKSGGFGSTRVKEQILVFYNIEKLEILKSFVDDGQKQRDLDAMNFERPPFMTFFQSKERRNFKFLIMNAHLKPDQVLKELTVLESLYRKMEKNFQEASLILVMGDLNADKPYLNIKSENIPFFSNNQYEVLISNNQLTTVTLDRPSSYDKFIINKKYKSVIEDSTVFYVDRELTGVSYLEMNSISNHYPITTTINCKKIKTKKKKNFLIWRFWNWLTGGFFQRPNKYHNEEIIKEFREEKKVLKTVDHTQKKITRKTLPSQARVPEVNRVKMPNLAGHRPLVRLI